MVDLKIFTKNVEEKALNQINLLTQQKAFENSKIRIMPDVHAGKGCVIGFTADLGDKVIPNLVGVDICCGLYTVELGNINLDLAALDCFIKKSIPNGFEVYDKKIDDFYFENMKCFNYLRDVDRLERSLGTLGGGNHFIEIDIDDENNKYLIIHTGSRNLGKQVAEYYQDKAIKYCSFDKECQLEIQETIVKLKKENKAKEIENAIKSIKEKYFGLTKLPKELCFLEGNDRDDYLHDMEICQEFAKENREWIAQKILEQLNISAISEFQTVHNYIDSISNVVRKGAISAKENEKVLIPINMKDGCILALGKGNEDWNCSAPHGAGRILSRRQAKEKIKLEDYEESMKEIFTTSVCEETIDESPGCYKSIDEIIENTKDTIEIIKILKPIYNFKSKNG